MDRIEDQVIIEPAKAVGAVAERVTALLNGRIDDLPWKTSGFRYLDNMIHLENGTLTVVGSGSDETASILVLSILARRLETLVPEVATLVFSFKESPENYMLRLALNLSEVSLKRLRDRVVSKKQSSDFARALKRLHDSKVSLVDAVDLGADGIVDYAQKLHSREPLGLIIVDSLQFLNGPADQTRDQQIAEGLRAIRSIAKRFDVPVIAVSSLTRDYIKEYRSPKLQDLRDSGFIEYAADSVVLLQLMPKTEESDWSTPERVKVTVAKHYSGVQPFEFNLNYRPEYFKFNEDEFSK